MSTTAKPTSDRLSRIIQEYNKEQSRERMLGIHGQLKKITDEIDGVKLNGEDTLKGLFRKNLSKTLLDRLNDCIANAAQGVSKTQSDMVSIIQARITPPSVKTTLSSAKEFTKKQIKIMKPNHSVKANHAKNIHTDSLKNNMVSRGCLIITQMTPHIKEGLARSDKNNNWIGNQIKAVLKPPGLDTFCDELSIVICGNILKEKIFKNDKNDVLRFAEDLAYLCYIIILGIDPDPNAKINIKEKILKEIQSCGFFNSYDFLLEHAINGFSLPGTSQLQSDAIMDATSNPTTEPSAVIFRTRTKVSGVGSHSASAATSANSSPEPSTHASSKGTSHSNNKEMKIITDQSRTCPSCWSL